MLFQYHISIKLIKFSILHPETTVVVQVRTARAAVLTDEEEEGEEGEEGTEEVSEEEASE